MDVLQYQVTTTNINSPTGVKVDTIENVMSVRDIGWEEGSDHITITTDDQVHTNFNIQVAKMLTKICQIQVLLYPLDSCGDSATCQECTAEGGHPLCGWCTVENKCSRSFQCQDSSEPRRWVTSSDQCISATVSPSQFILDSPTIVSRNNLTFSFLCVKSFSLCFLQLNVTVSPVPGLPEGLTYNCSFSTDSGAAKFPLLVPAIEMETGTGYICNITDIATTLDRVKQGLIQIPE